MLKRFLSLLFFLLILAVVTTQSQAQSGISYPPETEVVQGVVNILGTANNPEFWKYELAAAPFNTQNWFNIGVSETAVNNGLLGRWDSNTVPDGTYTLRLRVVRRDGNYDEILVRRVLVNNSGPTATPTTDVTPTPTITPTSPPPTATPVVLTPVIPTPTLAPEVTPTTEVAGPIVSDDDGPTDEAEGDSLTSIGDRVLDAFIRGARTVLIVFMLVGFFFAVKYVLNWLYIRFLVR